MSDEDPTLSAGGTDEVHDPAETETTSLGNSGSGAEDRDHEDGQVDENSASDSQPDPDNQQTDDEELDALAEALSSGTLGDDAKAKDDETAKPEAKPDDATTDAATDDAKPQDGDAKTEAKPDELTPDEVKELEDTKPRTQQQRKAMKGLLLERRTLRKEVETIKPAKAFADGVIKHAKDAGISKAEDLYALIEEERILNSQKPEERAAYYRALADRIHPQPKAPEAPKPVVLADDLKSLVQVGDLKPDEADALQRLRDAKANPQKESVAKPEPTPAGEPAATTKTPDARAQQQTHERACLQVVAKVSAEYVNRYGSEWPAIAKQVQTRLHDLTAEGMPTTTAAMEKLTRTAIELVLAKRQPAAAKKPTVTPRSTTPAHRPKDVTSVDEDVDALMKGRL